MTDMARCVRADISAVEWRIIGRAENKAPPGRTDCMTPLMAQRLCLKQAEACERQFEPEYRSALEAYDKVRPPCVCLFFCARRNIATHRGTTIYYICLASSLCESKLCLSAYVHMCLK